MPVRFVLGRAGSGKTHHGLTALAEELAKDPVDGPRLILLVPEQASMQMERALLGLVPERGLARCEVLSFRRLAHRVLAACGLGGAVVSDTARLMALRQIIGDLEDELVLFGSRRGRRGLVDSISRTLDELVQEDVWPDDLAEAAANVEAENPGLAARLADLHRIFRAYVDRLGDERTDPSHHLALARQHLDALPHLKGALIWVDGFAGFTRQEQRLLVELAGLAGHVDVGLLLDPDDPSARGEGPIEPFDLFARTVRTYQSLCEDLRQAGVVIEDPLSLHGTPPRFASAPPLAGLEARLFRPRVHASTDAPSRGASGAHVRLIQAANRRVEVAAAVAEIRRLVTEGEPRLRYRDIAVIVRDLEPYHDLLVGSLSEAGIPHFIDRRRTIRHHALVEAVRSLLELADSADPDAVVSLAKSGLCGLDDGDAELLENYLLAQGLSRRSDWTQGAWEYRRRLRDEDAPSRLTPAQAQELERLDEIRARLVDALAPWWALSETAEPPTCRAWAEALYATLERFGVPERLQTWLAEAEADGDVEQAQELRQIWSHVVAMLDDLAGEFGDEPMTASDLDELVDSALSSATLALAPPTLDQVLVGSIERSRHPAIRAALVLGFAEGHFPLRQKEDPILTDDHRAALEQAGLPLQPGAKQRLFDERLLAYIALTRPSELLWIGWPAAEQDGRACMPSPFVGAIRSVLPELETERLAEPHGSRQTWAICTPDDLVAGIACDVRVRQRPGMADTEADHVWNGLYNAALADPSLRDLMARTLTSLRYRNEARLDQAFVERLLDGHLLTSVTRIETFAACPFRHFAQYLLDLQPRETCHLDAVDLGVHSHRVLERLVDRLVADRRRLPDLEDNDLAELLHGISKDALAQLVDDVLLGDPRNAYLVEHNETDLHLALLAQRFVAAAGRYRPVGTEVTFGLPETEDDPARLRLPALEIVTPQGRSVALRGKIDRIDLADLGGRALATVLDYKLSSDRRLRLDRVLHGLDLQLMTYLLVVDAYGDALAERPVEPSGAFYVSLLDTLQSVPTPPEAPPSAAERYRDLRPRGLIDAGELESFDQHLGPGEGSEVVAVRLTNAGEPGWLNTTDVADSESFRGALAFVRQRVGELCDDLLDGRIDVAPYRLGQEMPCTYCDYQSLCRFEFHADAPRELQAMGRTEVLARMAEYEEGPFDA